jgi:hypothetical protein
MFDWQDGKGNPSQPPLFRGGAYCAAEHAPPCQGGLGGLPFDQKNKKTIENAAK